MNFKWLFILLFVAFGGMILFSNVDMLVPYRNTYLFVALAVFIVVFITSVVKLKKNA